MNTRIIRTVALAATCTALSACEMDSGAIQEDAPGAFVSHDWGEPDGYWRTSVKYARAQVRVNGGSWQSISLRDRGYSNGSIDMYTKGMWGYLFVGSDTDIPCPGGSVPVSLSFSTAAIGSWMARDQQLASAAMHTDEKFLTIRGPLTSHSTVDGMIQVGYANEWPNTDNIVVYGRGTSRETLAVTAGCSVDVSIYGYAYE